MNAIGDCQTTCRCASDGVARFYWWGHYQRKGKKVYGKRTSITNGVTTRSFSGDNSVHKYRFGQWTCNCRIITGSLRSLRKTAIIWSARSPNTNCCLHSASYLAPLKAAWLFVDLSGFLFFWEPWSPGSTRETFPSIHVFLEASESTLSASESSLSSLSSLLPLSLQTKADS